MRWSVFFYLSSKRNRKFKHLVQTKPMGENTITNIMKVGKYPQLVLALKKVRKKFMNHNARITTVSKLKKTKICKFRICRQCHRPQRYKLPQQLRSSRRRSATMTLSCNMPSEIMKTQALRKSKSYINILAVSDITTTVAPLTHR